MRGSNRRATRYTRPAASSTVAVVGASTIVGLMPTMWCLLAVHARLFIWGGKCSPIRPYYALHAYSFQEMRPTRFLFGSLFIILCRGDWGPLGHFFIFC